VEVDIGVLMVMVGQFQPGIVEKRLF